MLLINKTKVGAAIGAGVFASLAMLPLVHAELVYENDVQRLDRQNLSPQVVVTTPVQQYQPIQQIQPVQPVQQVVTTPTYQATVPQQVVVAPTRVVETDSDSLSKSELVRRERVRAELRNEDMLQERIEELRLRDERRRTENLLNSHSTEASNLTVGLRPETVIVSQTEPTVLAQATVQNPSVQAFAVSTPGSQVSIATIEDDRSLGFIIPRAGLSNMNNSYYDVRGRYSAGVDVGVSVSDNLSFELGYMYSEYGIAPNTANPFGAWATNYGYGLQSYETYGLNQNVVDLGLKLHVLGRDAKLRPFVGGGASYSKSFINYSQQILSYYNQMRMADMARDFEMTSYLGYLSGGFDVRVNRSISIGATFKYYKVLTARQSNAINNFAMYGYNPYNYGGLYNAYNSLPDAEKQALGGSIADSSFYSITAGLSFFF